MVSLFHRATINEALLERVVTSVMRCQFSSRAVHCRRSHRGDPLSLASHTDARTDRTSAAAAATAALSVNTT